MVQPTRRDRSTQKIPETNLLWSDNTELVGLQFELEPIAPSSLPLQYTVGLHAWFLDQVRQIDRELSAYLHDGESEKAFTLSSLDGALISQGRQVQLQVGHIYRWNITALAQPVVQWLVQWLDNLPETVELRQAPLKIRSIAIAQPPTTYAELYQAAQFKPGTVTLSFITASKNL